MFLLLLGICFLCLLAFIVYRLGKAGVHVKLGGYIDVCVGGSHGSVSRVWRKN